MADAINTGGIRPVTLPNQFPPVPAVLRILSRFDRQQLHGFIAVALDLADAMDGDPDLETCAVEDDGTPMPKEIDFGPGCEVSDSGENAWIEWDQMRGSQKRGPNLVQDHEDDEEDDPAGQYDEDYYTGPAKPGYGPGCTISDDDHGIDDLRQGTAGLDC